MNPTIRKAIPIVALLVIAIILFAPVLGGRWWGNAAIALIGGFACWVAPSSWSGHPERGRWAGMFLFGVALTEAWYNAPGLAQ